MYKFLLHIINVLFPSLSSSHLISTHSYFRLLFHSQLPSHHPLKHQSNHDFSITSNLNIPNFIPPSRTPPQNIRRVLPLPQPSTNSSLHHNHPHTIHHTLNRPDIHGQTPLPYHIPNTTSSREPHLRRQYTTTRHSLQPHILIYLCLRNADLGFSPH